MPSTAVSLSHDVCIRHVGGDGVGSGGGGGGGGDGGRREAGRQGEGHCTQPPPSAGLSCVPL